jgi:hypothetical protein
MKSIGDSAANSSKVNTQKIEALYNDYKILDQERELQEMLLEQDYIENIKIKRGDSELAYKNYLEERTILYDAYIEDSTEESLRRLITFHIKSMKDLNISNKYDNIYTKYANIRNVM